MSIYEDTSGFQFQDHAGYVSGGDSLCGVHQEEQIAVAFLQVYDKQGARHLLRARGAFSLAQMLVECQ